MNENQNTAGARFGLGVILVLVGGLFLLKSFGIYIPFSIFSWYFLMFAAGILILINSQKKTLGIIFTLIGGFYLFRRAFGWYDIDFEAIFAIAIIALGIHIIFKHRRSSEYNKDSHGSFLKKDVIDDISIFGGGAKIINSENFKGGNITAIFGGSELDLTNCTLAEGNNVIDVLIMFGGTEIRVPNSWNVILSVTPIFGGFSNKIRRDPNIPVDQSKTLIIKGLAMFGGGEIKSKF